MGNSFWGKELLGITVWLGPAILGALWYDLVSFYLWDGVFTTTVWCFVSSVCDVSPLIWPVRWTPRPVRWTPMAVRSTPLIPLRSLKAYYSIYMSLNMLDLPPFDRVLNTLQCDVHCGHPMRRQPVISEFKVAILKKCPMNPGFTLVYTSEFSIGSG